MLAKLFKRQSPKAESAPIEFAGQVIHVQRKKMTSLRLKVHPHNGNISLSVPIRTQDSIIMQFLQQQRHWLEQQQQRLLQRNKDHTQQPNSLFLWGEEYPVRRSSQSQCPTIRFAADTGFSLCGHNADREAIIIENFYRQQLVAHIKQWQQFWPQRLNVTATHTGVRKMHTKWGSCNVTHKRIWLALELVKYPKQCAEMVYLHELVHLLERNHTPLFYELMSFYMQDWQKWDDILRRGE